MNIAYFTNVRINPQCGGIERITNSLMLELQARGHNTFNIFYHGKEDGITNFKLNISEDLTQVARQVDNIIRKHKIDIIVEQFSHVSIPDHRYLKEKVKFIRCLHTATRPKYGIATYSLLRNFNLRRMRESLMKVLYWLNTPLRNKKQEQYLENICQGVDRFVLLDEDFYLPKTISRDIVAAIPNGLPIVDATYCQKKRQILYVGRLHDNEKNTRFIVRFWRKLYRDFPDWKFIICGDGPDRQEMLDYLERHGLKNIEFKGTVDPTEYYKESPILVLPSYFEGFPMVLVEAMQYGCVPMVFDVSASFHNICNDTKNLDSEGKPKKCGIIVPAMNEKKYISACKKLMKNPALCRAIGEAGVEHVKEYDIEKVVDCWEQLFEEVMRI